MDLRPGAVPPATPEPGSDPAGGPARWRVSPGLVALKLAGTVIFAAITVFTLVSGTDQVGTVVAGAAALGLGGFALRDLVAPVRVEADTEGVTVVTGFARRARLPWSAIERVRVDVRSRYGLRSAHLEIDAGESIHLFGAAELSAPVEDVAATLEALAPVNRSA